MTLVQILLVGAAVALVLSPTLRIIAGWLVKWAVASVEKELANAAPALPNAVVNAAPTFASAAQSDLHTVLDLAAKLKAAGQPEAVKLCQQLIDQMLQQPKV
jgi:hypothetical protein